MPKRKAQSDGDAGGVKKRRVDDGDGSDPTYQEDGLEMVHQIKEKYDSATTRSENLSVLTVLPKSWSLHQIAKVFGTSRYLARRAKQLVADKGVLSNPKPKTVKILSAQTEVEVKNFYLADDISRIMPGKKDCVSVVASDGGKVHEQKRLLLTEQP